MGADTVFSEHHGVLLIGRDHQLAILSALLDRAAEGTPTTLLVHGDAGVGKSRLIREFELRARATGALVLTGSCIELGTGELPYAPLIQALRGLVRQEGLDTVRELAGTRYPELAGLIGDATDESGPLLLPTGGPSAQPRVFRAILHLLDRLGQDRPAVLIVEDLHWADQSTLDLVSYLSRLRSAERLLVVGSYRQPLRPGHPLRPLVAELELARRVQQLQVQPFDKDQLRQFLRASTLGPAPHDLVERAFQLSEGNPFYVEELLAAGALSETASVGPVRLPGPVKEVVLSRYEQLGADAQEVLRVAATAGRQVSHRLLETVCEAPPTQLPPRRMLAALRECVNRQMLVAAPGLDAYAFRHPLMREVVYQDVLPGERLALHESIATALTRDNQLSYAEGLTVAAELSYHWSEAHAWPLALAAAVRAGDAAMRLSAFREAGLQYERALAVWSQVNDPTEQAGRSRLDLLAAAAEAARWAGRIDGAVELARQAVAEVDPEQQPVLAGERYERLGSFQWDAGDRAGSAQCYARAADLLAGAPPSATAARVLAARAATLVHEGSFLAGLALGRQALEMAQAVRAKPEHGRALDIVGLALTMSGEVEEGLPILREAVRMAEAGGQIEDLYRAYGNLAIALEQAGRLADCVEVGMAGLARARQTGLDHTRGSGVLINNTAAALVQLGRWDEAVALLDDLLADRPLAETLFPRLTRAEIAVFQGDFDTAATLLDQVRTAGAAVRQPQFVGSVYAAAAEAAIWRRDYPAARTAVAAGLAALQDREHRGVLLRLCWLGLRNEVDEWLRRSAQPRAHNFDRASVATAMDDLAAQAERLGGTAKGPALPDATPLLLACRAENDRSGRTGRIPQWVPIAEAWNALDRPYPTGYAWWRAAEEAARTRRSTAAKGAARTAYQLAVQLGAQPLLREITTLAARAQLNLDPESPTETRSGPRTRPKREPSPFGLTKQQWRILDLLRDGRTDRQIAAELFIAPKTVGKHVSQVLDKLGVASRGEAAALANRLDLPRDNGTGEVGSPSFRPVRQTDPKGGERDSE